MILEDLTAALTVPPGVRRRARDGTFTAMGRGLGRVQRQVLEYLATTTAPTQSLVGGPPAWSIVTITAALYGPDHTDSQRRGVARAVSTLAARGSVSAELSAHRFREVTVTRSAYVPRYFDPEDGKYYGGRVIQMTESRPVPMPEVLVRLRRTDSAAMDAAIAEDRRLSGGPSITPTGVTEKGTPE
jgi:hypothetical protein